MNKPSEELMWSMLKWIHENGFSRELPEKLPMVQMISHDEMQTRDRHPILVINDMLTGNVIHAQYDALTKIIYLRTNWDPSNVRDRAHLVHELTHYAHDMEGFLGALPRDLTETITHAVDTLYETEERAKIQSQRMY